MPSAPEGAQEAWKWEWGPDSQLVQAGAGNQDLLANRHLPLCWIVLPPFSETGSFGKHYLPVVYTLDLGWVREVVGFRPTGTAYP